VFTAGTAVLRNPRHGELQAEGFDVTVELRNPTGGAKLISPTTTNVVIE